MTNDFNNNQIQCPNCKVSITVDELGEYVNANPETKKQAIEEELQLWGEAAYDRNYLIQNVVFCPKCCKVSHFDDWASSQKTLGITNKDSSRLSKRPREVKKNFEG